MSHWKLNTSNPGKLKEFKRLFAFWGDSLDASSFDLREINSTPIHVITHKASQLGENILVEDTILEIEEACVGIQVRWLLDHLSEYAGHQANWIVLLAYQKGEEIVIHRGCVAGIIVEPSGSKGFGFDPVFLPHGAKQTLAESKPDQFNARAKAVKALINGNIWAIRPVMKEWEGPWQNESH